jgi:clorobiocin biosynthesis protein CloN6
VNLSSVLLRYPTLDLEAFLRSVDTPVFGIDLHWMVHVQGSLAIAELIKSLHPSSAVLFGGISSTCYAEELIRYPFIDMVMRGYDTHAPMDLLLRRQWIERALDFGVCEIDVWYVIGMPEQDEARVISFQ